MAHSTFNLIVTTVWINLAHVDDKFLHAYHRLFITSLSLLDTVCAYLGLEFAPGLWDVLTSTTPPDFSFFKNLPGPLNETSKYGIYVLTLEKKGWRPRLYIGSSVNALGYYARTKGYKYVASQGKVFPKHVKKSLRLGFKITHIGMLMRCSNCNFSARLNEMARLVVLNFECTFSRIFFARTRNTDTFRHDVEMDAHLFADCILPGFVYWSKVDWDGQCGHSPIGILETPSRTFGLSDADYLRVEIERKDRRLAAKRAWFQLDVRRNIAKKKYPCCGKFHGTTGNLKQHQKTDGHLRSIGKLPPRILKSSRADIDRGIKKYQQNIKSAKFVCGCRPKPFGSKSHLLNHQRSKTKACVAWHELHRNDETVVDKTTTPELDEIEEDGDLGELDPDYASWSAEDTTDDEDDEE